MFRPPKYPILLCISVGMGVQVFSMFFIVLTAVVLGMIHPYVRYWFAVQSFFLLSIGGMFNGYVSAKLIGYFGAKEWRIAATAATFVLPVYLFTVFSVVDIIEWFEKSSAYQPFTSVIGLSLLWLVITAPVAYSGAYYGFTSEKIVPPCKVSSVRRLIPQ